MDEKMLKKLGLIIGGFVAFILILFLISSCSNKKYTYERLEQKMMSVAKSYYKNHEKELPSQDKDTKTYTLKKMISDGYIDELSELFDDENIKCSGDVTVINNNGYYMYSPNLTCGKDYSTVYLKDKIIEDSLVDGVDQKVGLYEVGDQYIFKGEVNNNYVSFNGLLYRIIRINEDGTIRLLQLSGVKNVVWDDRYNEEIRKTYGINEFINNGIKSRIKESLDSYYNDSTIWGENAKSYVTTQSLCIGKRSLEDTTTDGSTECAVKLEGQPFGALAVYEIYQSTLSDTCYGPNDENCTNYNWITNLENSFWLITARLDNPSQAYSFGLGQVGNAYCKSRKYLNVVINLSDKAVFNSGTGTSEDPYTIKMPEETK